MLVSVMCAFSFLRSNFWSYHRALTTLGMTDHRLRASPENLGPVDFSLSITYGLARFNLDLIHCRYDPNSTGIPENSIDCSLIWQGQRR